MILIVRGVVIIVCEGVSYLAKVRNLNAKYK